MNADLEFMDRALDLARRAELAGEVPVGAVIVDAAGTIVGEGANGSVGLNDPTAHAEIIALRAAAQRVGNYRLNGAILYATVEPCAMCAGAMVHARIDRLVYGAADPRAGAAGSVFNIVNDSRLNHRVRVYPGVRGEECRRLMQEFFEKRRALK
ncbi:MAG TPA: tRNA adenosine(34) deaminase TadA [Terriglobia bacterium]|nr:tRNA adenosine(34) deaminase TadA [Terriglobia bacterium]